MDAGYFVDLKILFNTPYKNDYEVYNSIADLISRGLNWICYIIYSVLYYSAGTTIVNNYFNW